jgi:hypothetical protein
MVADASPVKPARFDRKQCVGPSYIRLQVLSVALSLVDLPLTHIDPGNEQCIVCAVRDSLDIVYQKAQKRSLQLQSRRNTYSCGIACIQDLAEWEVLSVCCKHCMFLHVRSLDVNRGFHR